MVLERLNIKFCAAHNLKKLLGSEHKCSRLHGHNYFADVTLESNEDYPIIVDLGEIDEICKKLDHRCLNKITLADYKDELDKQNFLDIADGVDNVEHGGQMDYVIEHGIKGLQGINEDGSDSPTVENISRWLLREIENHCKNKEIKLSTLKVKVYETPTSAATEVKQY